MWNRSSVKAAHGRSTTPSGQNGVEKRSTVKLQPGSWHSREGGEKQVFDRENFYHHDPDATEVRIEFRVKVVGHESNSKMAHIFVALTRYGMWGNDRRRRKA